MKERIEQERWYHDRLAEKDAELDRHRALHTRAADALEEDYDVMKDFFSKTSVRDKFLGLIAELRKAAGVDEAD